MTANWLFCAGGYYRYDEGFTPLVRGQGAVRRTDRAPAALAGGPGLRGQEGRGDRQRCDGRHADPGAGGHGRPCHHAPAFAHLHPSGRVAGRDREHAAEGVAGRPRPPAHPAQEHRHAALRLADLATPPTGRATSHPRREHQAAAGRLSRGRALQPVLITGTSGGACTVPDADLFKALKKGTASVVTDRIATFTETGIRLSPVVSSTPTSSSPPPG